MEDFIISEEKKVISEVLNIENNASWSIIDQVDDLRLVYYTKIKSKIRGQIVDIKDKKLIVDVYGKEDSPIIEVITNNIPNNLNIVDINLEEYNLEEENLTFEKGIEGSIIRCFRYKDKNYVSTQKRIDCSKSRWIVTPTFLEMFKELNGPADIPFIGNEVYYFLLSHQAVQQASYNFKESKLYFLEAKGNYNKTIAEDLKVLFPKDDMLSFEDANKYLQPRIMNDYRSESGDFLIVRGHDKNRNQDFIFKVLSRSYYWRLEIVNNDPNLYHLWCNHTSSSIIGSKFTINDDEFEKKYLIPRDIMYINKLKEIDYINMELSDFEYQKDVSLNRMARICVIFFNLLFCISKSKRNELFEVYNKYNSDKERLSNKIYNDYIKNIDYETINSPINRIRSQALKYNQDKKIKSTNDNVRLNIKKLVDNEIGSSLYKMLKSIDN